MTLIYYRIDLLNQKAILKRARLHGLMICIEVLVYVSMTREGVFARGDKYACILRGGER